MPMILPPPPSPFLNDQFSTLKLTTCIYETDRLGRTSFEAGFVEPIIDFDLFIVPGASRQVVAVGTAFVGNFMRDIQAQRSILSIPSTNSSPCNKLRTIPFHVSDNLCARPSNTVLSESPQSTYINSPSLNHVGFLLSIFTRTRARKRDGDRVFVRRFALRCGDGGRERVPVEPAGCLQCFEDETELVKVILSISIYKDFVVLHAAGIYPTNSFHDVENRDLFNRKASELASIRRCSTSCFLCNFLHTR